MLKAEDLAKMSINDLNLLASSKQISLSNTTTTGTASESGYIGAARAEEIALKHAGLQADAADSIRTELDCDNGEMEYEVDFRAGGVEYEYAIHARSGKVLRYEYEVAPDETTPRRDTSPHSRPSGCSGRCRTDRRRGHLHQDPNGPGRRHNAL